MRIAICGGPRTGKTTLACSIGGEPGVVLRATDDLIATHDWSAASAEAATWFDTEPGPMVVEGTAVVRAIRKWLRAHPDGRPVDVVKLLTRPKVPLTPGQAAMAKGHAKIWAEVEPELRRRGVAIEVEA